MKKLLIIFLSLLILTGCTSNSKDEEIIFITVDQPIEVPYGSTIDLLSDSIILETNGEVSTSDNLNVLKVGIQTIQYKVTHEGKTETKEVQFLILEKADEEWLESIKYKSFTCDIDSYFVINEGIDEIQIVMNPDGYVDYDNPMINIGVGDILLYTGHYERVGNTVYSIQNGEFNKEYINTNKFPVFQDNIDGYIKLEGDKLYFFTSVLSLEEMEGYNSSNYCTLD